MLTAKFEKEKETKNTIRYSEIVEDAPPIIGTLYLQKFACKRLGNPSTITLTVEAGD